MCGRYMIVSSIEAMQRVFRFEERPNLPARYNVAPGQEIPIVRRKREGEGRELALVRWGLIPHWAKDPSIGNRMINARAETLATKPAFREALRKRRCLVPANGFYEWEKQGRRKQPWLIRAKDGGLLAFAGLWEVWHDPEGSRIESCTIVTGEPNRVAARVHDRMPVILAPADYGRWLDAEPQDAQALLGPCPDAWLEAYPVSTQVNSPKNDSPDLIEPMQAQDDLFEPESGDPARRRA